MTWALIRENVLLLVFYSKIVTILSGLLRLPRYFLVSLWTQSLSFIPIMNCCPPYLFLVHFLSSFALFCISGSLFPSSVLPGFSPINLLLFLPLILSYLLSFASTRFSQHRRFAAFAFYRFCACYMWIVKAALGASLALSSSSTDRSSSLLFTLDFSVSYGRHSLLHATTHF